METTSWSLPAVFEVIAAAVPDRDMLVWKQTRRTYAEVERRTRSLAARAIARFKATRAIAFCDAVRRHANGKPDYAWARAVAADATAATAL